LVVDYILAAELGARYINLQGWRPCEHVARVSVERTAIGYPSEPVVEATNAAVLEAEFTNASETKDAEAAVTKSDETATIAKSAYTANPAIPVINDEEAPVYRPPPVVSDISVPITYQISSELARTEGPAGVLPLTTTKTGEERFTKDAMQSLLLEADRQKGEMAETETKVGEGGEVRIDSQDPVSCATNYPGYTKLKL
jgi:hypothetical protein